MNTYYFYLQVLTDDDIPGPGPVSPDHEQLFNMDGSINESLAEEADNLPDKPARVLVFTSLTLLSLFALCRHGNVDGTFKSIPRNWTQLFIWMLDFEKAAVPVCFGWLPDKTLVSYYTFVFLVLWTFRKYNKEICSKLSRSRAIIKLQKIKCDFETNIHTAFSMFRVRTNTYFYIKGEKART